MCGERPVGNFGEGTVAVPGLATTLEHDGVATFPRERRDLHQGIGAGFEDCAHHAQRAANTFEDQTGVELAMLEPLAHQLGHFGKLGEVADQAVDFLVVEAQAFEQSGLELTAGGLFLRARHVACVGGEHGRARLRLIEGGGKTTQERGARGTTESGEAAGGPARGVKIVGEVCGGGHCGRRC